MYLWIGLWTLNLFICCVQPFFPDESQGLSTITKCFLATRWLVGRNTEQELFTRRKNGNDVMMAQFAFLFLRRAIFRETFKEIKYRRKCSKGMHLLLLALRIFEWDFFKECFFHFRPYAIVLFLLCSYSCGFRNTSVVILITVNGM